MIRTIILDNLATGRRRLSLLLSAEPDIEIVHAGDSWLGAKETIEQARPALMFLDTDLADGRPLDSLAPVLQALRPHVVLVTAYEHFAVAAFEAGVSDYLLKPISAVRMQTCLARVRAAYMATPAALATMATMAAHSHTPTARADALDSPATRKSRNRIAVKVGKKRFLLEIDSIEWCEAAGNYVIFHTAGARHVVRGAIGDMPRLLGTDCFPRISKSTVVNTRQIASLEQIGEGELDIALINGGHHTVSRVYRKELETSLAMIATPADA